MRNYTRKYKKGGGFGSLARRCYKGVCNFVSRRRAKVAPYSNNSSPNNMEENFSRRPTKVAPYPINSSMGNIDLDNIDLLNKPNPPGWTAALQEEWDGIHLPATVANEMSVVEPTVSDFKKEQLVLSNEIQDINEKLMSLETTGLIRANNRAKHIVLRETLKRKIQRFKRLETLIRNLEREGSKSRGGSRKSNKRRTSKNRR